LLRTDCLTFSLHSHYSILSISLVHLLLSKQLRNRGVVARMLQGDLPLFSRDGGLAYQRLFCSCLTRALADTERADAAAADHAAARLVSDLTVGQCLLEVGDTCLAEKSPFIQMKRLQVLQSLDVSQSEIVDVGVS